MRYKIVKAGDADQVQSEMNDAASEGWRFRDMQITQQTNGWITYVVVMEQDAG